MGLSADTSVDVYAAYNVRHIVSTAYTDADDRWGTGGIDYTGPIKIRARDYSGAHVTTWYRNAKTIANATRLTLTDGGEIDDIGFVLRAA